MKFSDRATAETVAARIVWNVLDESGCVDDNMYAQIVDDCKPFVADTIEAYVESICGLRIREHQELFYREMVDVVNNTIASASESLEGAMKLDAMRLSRKKVS